MQRPAARHRGNHAAWWLDHRVLATLLVVEVLCGVALHQLLGATGPYAHPNGCGVYDNAPAGLALAIWGCTAIGVGVVLQAVRHVWAVTARASTKRAIGLVAGVIAVDIVLALANLFLELGLAFPMEALVILLVVSPWGDGPAPRRGVGTKLATLTLMVGVVDMAMSLLALAATIPSHMSC